MKLKIVFVIIAALLLLGCKDNVEEGEVIGDPGTTAHWIYKNSTDKEVKVDSYYCKNPKEKEYKIDISFSIPVGGEHIITDPGGIGYASPFQWEVHSQDRYLIITNGEKQVKQFRRVYVNTLYYTERYVQHNNPDNNNELYFTYTFTDEDFKNAKPVTEMSGVI